MMKIYEDELRFSKNKSELNNYNSLISFLSSYYQEQLQLDQDESAATSQRKKQPLKRDEI